MQKTLSQTITRFAPSPTGYLHVGSARTALFNLLFARHTGGRFLLRIDDTDRERSTEAAVRTIFDGLAWLGIQWDGEAVFQHTRLVRHAEIAHALLESGQAYRCYASAEDLAEMRRRATAAGRPPRYDGTWRDRDPGEAPAGVTPAIRLKAPQDGETIVEDLVLGPIRFANRELDDFVLLRSDGSPTYMLSTVVDDQDMSVTHVIRGNDHLTNAARQVQIYDAMGWPRPAYAHLPLIHGADGQKLSKRHGAVSVESYAAEGYLSEALNDYLLGLGWNRGGAKFLDLAEGARQFDLSGIAHGPARFDLEALTEVNFHWIKQAADDRLAALIMPRMPALIGRPVDDTDEALLARGMPGLKERAKTLAHLAEYGAFYLRSRPLVLDADAGRLLDEAALDRLERLRRSLAGADWTRASLEAAVKAVASDLGAKFPAVAQPLRAALTGRTNAPGVSEILEVLGREESLGRIDDVLAKDRQSD